MEQSIRILLNNNNIKPSEQNLLNIYNKIISGTFQNISSDIYILLAEKFFELSLPIQKHIIDKAEKMISLYNRLQEPMNQFQIRSYICHSQIYSYRAKNQRGNIALELNTKAIDYITRALKSIQSNSLYQPLSLRAVFVYYQVSFPFFPHEFRNNLMGSAPLALSLLETHLINKLDTTLRLFITLSILNGCLYDDIQKPDEAVKIVQKLFTLIPQEHLLF